MKADPKKSAGARVERKAFRGYLKRQISIVGKTRGALLVSALNWVYMRQSRYDKAPGGLGKK